MIMIYILNIKLSHATKLLFTWVFYQPAEIVKVFGSEFGFCLTLLSLFVESSYTAFLFLIR